MFDYSPKLPELIFYPIFGGLFAWGIARNFPSPNSDLFSCAIYVNCAFVSSFYLYREACRYIDSATPSRYAEKFTATIDDMPTRADNNFPKIQSGGEPLYNQQMVRLKIDCVGLFNKTLRTQRRGNLDIRMDEGYWLKEKVGPNGETRWTQIGGDGPTSFRDMLRRGKTFGAYKQTGGQNRWSPDDWQKIRRLEQGEVLPQ
jgi:hypothetical protein